MVAHRPALWSAVVVLAVAVALGAGLPLLYRHARAAHRTSATVEARQFASRLQTLFSSSVQVLNVMRVAIQSVRGDITYENFRAMAAPATMVNNGTSLGFFWLPRVFHADKQRYEMMASSLYPPGQPCEFFERRQPDGRRVPVEPRPEYLPVLMVYPYETNSAVVCFDLTSASNRNATVSIARDSGMASATESLQLVQGGSAVIVMNAVYSENLPANASLSQRRNAYIGIVDTVIRIQAILDTLLGTLPLDTYLLLLDADDEIIWAGDGGNPETATRDASPIFQTEIQVADHVWSVLFFSTFSIHRAPTGVFVVVTVSVGLIIWAVIMLFFVLSKSTRIHLLKQRAEAFDSLLAKLAHEFRTPLNSIKMSSQILNADCDEESISKSRVKKFASFVASAVSVMQGYIESILTLSTMQYADRKPINSVFVVDDFLEHLTSFVEPLCQEKSLEFVIDNQLTAETLCSDKGRLRQILLNLLSNAVKFTERGQIVLRCSHAIKRVKDQEMIEFVVTDTGAGMDDESLLFSPFFQVSSSSRKMAERTFEQNKDILSSNLGSGLGLAVCRELVRHLGGEISVVSTPGHGSSFTFTIVNVDEANSGPKLIGLEPDHPGLSMNDEWDAQSSRRMQVVVGGEGSMRVLPDNIFGDFSEGSEYASESSEFGLLLVEDHETNRLICTDLINQLAPEVHVHGANNGMQALTKCKRQKFGLILMDIRMPIMDGPTATLEIRTGNNLNNETPIVGLSAQCEIDWRALGMNDFILKPISPDALQKVLKVYLNANPANARITSFEIDESKGKEEDSISEHEETSAAIGAEPSLRVLVIDDMATGRIMASRLLSATEEVASVVALRGNEVLDTDWSCYDVVFVADQLPASNFHHAALFQSIRSAAKGAATPQIVLMSGSGGDGAHSHPLASSVDLVTPKPLTKDGVENILSCKRRKCRTAPSDTELVSPALIAYVSPEQRRHIIEGWKGRTRHQIAEMLSCCDQEDWSALDNLAHTVKGSSGQLGASRLSEMSAELQQVLQKFERSEPDKVAAHLHIMNIAKVFQKTCQLL